MLKIKNLKVSYQGKDKPVRAIRDVSLTFKERTAYGIVGESGSGKSTLALAILRLLPKETSVSGEILFNGNDILDLDQSELLKLRWEKLAVVFQSSMNSLSPVHRISDQIIDVYLAHRLGEKKSVIKEKALDIFKILNLDERSFNAYPHELSGGMIQRVNIGLSLILDPDILILDEATTALDVITEQQILDEIMRIEKERPLLRLTITHDISVVSRSCDRVMVMYGGRCLEEGPVQDVFENPLHPYTKGLLDSYPDLEHRGKDLEGIPGTLFDLREDGPACGFATRCPYAQSICFKSPSPLVTKNEQRCLCHYPLEGSR